MLVVFLSFLVMMREVTSGRSRLRTVGSHTGRLENSGCEHLPDLHPLVGSSNASLLNDIPKEIQRIVS
jgi:hypothetical protein